MNPSFGRYFSAKSATQEVIKQPIPSPSHPRQYRAIGLIRGKYEISTEKINRGFLVDSQGQKIRVVLLQRVIGLIRKQLDLTKEHLWVVYPRTKIDTGELHLQIVGVWEPKTLAKNSQVHNLPNYHLQNKYFSIRGEVINVNPRHQTVIVKIKRKPQGKSAKPTFFKLKLHGVLPHNSEKHFWDFDVHLEQDRLVIQKSTDLGSLNRQIKPIPKSVPPAKTDLSLRRTRKAPSRQTKNK